MKKIIVLYLVVAMCLFMNVSFADSIQIEPLLNSSISIKYNGDYQFFYDANSKKVVPISYEGTTYLPIRAISSLFKEKISWDGDNKTIYLGTGEVDQKASKAVFYPTYDSPTQKVSAIINKDIDINYNDNSVELYNVNHERVYPISFEGTNYLPVRAISELFNADIEWDEENKTVLITNPNTNEEIENVDGFYSVKTYNQFDNTVVNDKYCFSLDNKNVIINTVETGKQSAPINNPISNKVLKCYIVEPYILKSISKDKYALPSNREIFYESIPIFIDSVGKCYVIKTEDDHKSYDFSELNGMPNDVRYDFDNKKVIFKDTDSKEYILACAYTIKRNYHVVIAKDDNHYFGIIHKTDCVDMPSIASSETIERFVEGKKLIDEDFVYNIDNSNIRTTGLVHESLQEEQALDELNKFGINDVRKCDKCFSEELRKGAFFSAIGYDDTGKIFFKDIQIVDE